MKQDQHKKTAERFTPPFVLALDVGTTSTRALLFDATGATIPDVLSQITYTLTTSPSGEASVDADMLTDLVARTIDEALKQAGDRAQQIGAVAIDTFWHSLLGIDKAGKPIMPLITWEDTRPFSVVSQLRDQLDEQEVHKRTGAIFHASYWPAKLLWLAKEQPRVYARAAQWLSFGEYLHHKFLGHAVCSLSMASGTGLLTTAQQTWDTELIRTLHVKPEALPGLGDLHDSISGLRSEYAARWPALRDVRWFPALGDGAAANIGSGCASKDTWSITIGTSSALRAVIAREEPLELPKGLWLYLIDAQRALVGGALSEGGNLLAWIAKTLNGAELKDLEPLAADVKPDGHGLTILPFISGERSPGWHADARMTITGLSLHTTPAEVLRASMEALAYQIKAVYDQLQGALKREHITPKLVGSGGTLLHSTDLQGMLADILNTDIYPSRAHEASARGAALLALEAMGKIKDVAKVPPQLEAPVHPNKKHGELYRRAAERQQALYEKMLTQQRKTC